jgi:hypothetical protein
MVDAALYLKAAPPTWCQSTAIAAGRDLGGGRNLHRLGCGRNVGPGYAAIPIATTYLDYQKFFS